MSKLSNLTIKEMSLGNQKQIINLYNSIQDYYKSYTYDNRNNAILYDDFLKLVGLDVDDKEFTDLTMQEILDACNKAKKLAFKHDSKSRTELMKIWKEISLERESFELMQSNLHMENFVVGIIEWHDIVFGKKICFDRLSELQIIDYYDKAKKLAMLDNPVKIFLCNACEKYSYVILDEEKQLQDICDNICDECEIFNSDFLFCRYCIADYEFDECL